MNILIDNKEYQINRLITNQEKSESHESISFKIFLKESKYVCFKIVMRKEKGEKLYRYHSNLAYDHNVFRKPKKGSAICTLCNKDAQKHRLSKCEHLRKHLPSVIKQVLMHPSIRLRFLNFKNKFDFDSMVFDEKVDN